MESISVGSEWTEEGGGIGEFSERNELWRRSVI